MKKTKVFRFPRGPYKGLTISERDDAMEEEWAKRAEEMKEERKARATCADKHEADGG